MTKKNKMKERKREGKHRRIDAMKNRVVATHTGQ